MSNGDGCQAGQAGPIAPVAAAGPNGYGSRVAAIGTGSGVESCETSSTMSQVTPGVRPLSLPGLVAIIYYSVCGGPFGSEGVVAAAGPFFALLGFAVMPLVWSVPEALVAAELGTAFPYNSGYVTWVTAAFGPFWGFLEGFLSWLSGVCDSAIYPALFREYLVHVWPDVDQGFTGYAFVLSFSLSLTYLNYRGLHIVGWSAFALAVFTIMPFVYIVPAGLMRVEVDNLFLAPSLKEIDWTSYLNILFWSLNYWDTASTLAGEVQNPRNTFPAALLVTVLLVVLSYFLPLLAGIGLPGKHGGAAWRSWTEGSLALVGKEVGGQAIAAWVVASAAVSNIGQFVSEQAACSFQLLGMAELGWLPTSFAQRSTHGTPTVGLLLGLFVILSLSTFDFQSIVDLLNGVYCMAQLLEFAAFLQLRHAHGALRRPYRIPLKSTFSCVLLLLAPMVFCVVILVLPVVERDWLQVAFVVISPMVGVLLYILLSVCRSRAWLTFSGRPPSCLEEVLAAQSPFGPQPSNMPCNGMEELFLDAPS